MRTRAVRAVVGLMAVVLSAGCGVASSDGPQPLPSDLASLARPAVAPPLATTPAAPTTDVAVTWVRHRTLVLAHRAVVARGRQARLDAALEVLIGGPDRVEVNSGLTTLIPSDASMKADLKGHRATIGVHLAVQPPGNLGLAVGQVAVTALAIRGVRSVTFTVDGVAVHVPLPGGNESRGPVTARDYRGVVKTPHLG